jgi:putative redox protein
MEVNLKYLADEKYEVTNESGNVVAIDMLPVEAKKAQSPMQLLLSAVGACGAVDLVHMIKKRRKTLLDLKAVVTGERRNEIPKHFTAIHIKYIIYSPDLTDLEAAKLVKLAVEDYCSVGATLAGKAEITHSFEIVR